MQQIEQALVAYFESVARRDVVVWASIEREPAFDLGPAYWRFSLPDLHAFLQSQVPGFGAIDYHGFRKALFGSPINRAIGPYGAMIEIAENLGKVDRSRYAMVWTSPGRE